MAGESKTYTQEEFDAMLAEQLDGLKKNRDELAREAKAAKASLKSYDGVDPDEFKSLKTAAAAAEEKRAAAAGDFASLKTQMADAHKKELDARDVKLAKYDAALKQRLVHDELRRAISEHKGLADMQDLLVEHGAKHVRVRETDDGFEAYVADDRGNPRIADGSGTPMGIGDFVKSTLVAKFPRAFEGSGSSGGGATKSSGGAAGVTRIAAGDNKAFLDNLDGIASGKVEVEMSR